MKRILLGLLLGSFLGAGVRAAGEYISCDTTCRCEVDASRYGYPREMMTLDGNDFVLNGAEVDCTCSTDCSFW